MLPVTTPVITAFNSPVSAPTTRHFPRSTVYTAGVVGGIGAVTTVAPSRSVVAVIGTAVVLAAVPIRKGYSRQSRPLRAVTSHLPIG
jgi:hypothetical protein